MNWKGLMERLGIRPRRFQATPDIAGGPLTPAGILAHVRKLIQEHAQGDPDRWWYANRFVFARLQLDERKTKANIKRLLLQRRSPCHFCGQPIEGRKGIPIHRVDEQRGYSEGNCVLAHPACHEQHHATGNSGSTIARGCQPDAGGVLRKRSKRYEGAFLYWWDITPALAAALDAYDAVEFACDDTQASCLVPAQTLRSLLTQERQTSRGAGNWGVKVLADREDELAFEPGHTGKRWQYLPVVWLEHDPEG